MAEKMLDDMSEEDIARLFEEDETMAELFGEEVENDAPTSPKAPKSGLALPPRQSYAAAPRTRPALPPAQKAPGTKERQQSPATVPKVGLALPSRPRAPVTFDPRQSPATSREETGSDNKQPNAVIQQQHKFSAHIQEAAPWTGSKRKRTPEQSESESPVKKLKKTPDVQFRCRYGCRRVIKTKAALKMHAEKVHNLFYFGEAKHQCGLCRKMYRDEKDLKAHVDSENGCKYLWEHKKPTDWKFPPPSTVQECADTWGMAVHGEVSEHLRVNVDDQTDIKNLRPLPAEYQIHPREVAMSEQVPPVSRADTPMEGQATYTGYGAGPMEADDNQNSPVASEYIFNDFNNALTVIEELPNWPSYVPDWLWQQSGLNLDSKPGRSVDSPIVLD